jgi:hypothetical protein
MEMQRKQINEITILKKLNHAAMIAKRWNLKAKAKATKVNRRPPTKQTRQKARKEATKGEKAPNKRGHQNGQQQTPKGSHTAGTTTLTALATDHVLGHTTVLSSRRTTGSAMRHY